MKALEGETGRHLTLIAESDMNDPRIVRPWDVGGYGMDAQWADDFHHALHTVLTSERTGYYEDFGSLRQLAKALKSPYVYDGSHSAHRKRWHGRKPEAIPGHRFLVCTQNHDQIGNRATGERLSHLAGVAKAKLAAAVLMTSPYVPLIFQGEEWAASSPFQYFTQHEDRVLGRKVSEGRRKEFAAFGWAPEDVPDPQDPATFERSKLNWGERTKGEHAAMLDWYKSLIALRRSTPDLVSADLEGVDVQLNEREGHLLLRRGPVAVALNFGAERWFAPDVEGEVVLASADGCRRDREGLMIPPVCAAILIAGKPCDANRMEPEATLEMDCQAA